MKKPKENRYEHGAGETAISRKNRFFTLVVKELQWIKVIKHFILKLPGITLRIIP